MYRKLFQTTVWITLAQVLLVGALGTGLHTLLGCEHERPRDRSASSAPACDGCHCCVHRTLGADPATEQHDSPTFEPRSGSGSCDACVVCDLLDHFHSAVPAAASQPDACPTPLAEIGWAAQVHGASTARLPLSRGPPSA